MAKDNAVHLVLFMGGDWYFLLDFDFVLLTRSKGEIMSESERKLLAVILNVLIGSTTSEAVAEDLKWAAQQAGFTPAELTAVLNECEAA